MNAEDFRRAFPPWFAGGRHPLSSQSGQADRDDTHARTGTSHTRHPPSASRLHRAPRATKSRTPFVARRVEYVQYGAFRFAVSGSSL